MWTGICAISLEREGHLQAGYEDKSATQGPLHSPKCGESRQGLWILRLPASLSNSPDLTAYITETAKQTDVMEERET